MSQDSSVSSSTTSASSSLSSSPSSSNTVRPIVTVPAPMEDNSSCNLLLSTIGNTPMVELKKVNSNPLARVFVKLEYLNPSGSIKDRIAKHIIETYEKRGILKPGGIIVENSSGNTAAAVAMIGAIKGYQTIIVVPSKCSAEKQNSIKAFGAKLVVTDATAAPGTPNHYETVAKRLAAEIPGAVRLDQYNNQLNVEAHYLTTGPEIWSQIGGKIDYFVAGASTGGTVSGVGSYLKEKSEGRVKVVVADPNGSCLYNMVKSGSTATNGKKTQVEGIGKNYICQCMKFDVVDDAIQVEDADIFSMTRRLALEEGVLCGGSAGANVFAALQIAKNVTVPTTIVTVLPDGGYKYLSKIFNPDWLGNNNIISQKEKDEMARTDSLTVDQIISSYGTESK